MSKFWSRIATAWASEVTERDLVVLLIGVSMGVLTPLTVIVLAHLVL